LLFYLMFPPPPRSTLFPYTTLFRSQLAYRYADRRMVATGKLIEAPGVLIVLGGLVHRIRAVAALIQRIAEDLDAGAAVLTEVSRSEEHTSELQSLTNLVCRLLLEKK